MDRRITSIVLAVLLCAATADARMGITAVCGGFGQSAGGVTCTGSGTWLRGAGAAGDVEEFDYGSGDLCTTDWTISGSTGIDTYSTTQYKNGTHSLAMTDDTSTTPSYLRADHGSVQTAQYYRFWVYVPDVPNGGSFSIFAISKYNSSPSTYVSVVGTSSTTSNNIRVGSSTEQIPVGVDVWNRVEVYANDSDGSGAGYASITVKAWDASGTAKETTNGGGDYEIAYNANQDAYRYIWLQPENSNSTSATVYVDNVKNCDTWCGE